MYHILYSMAACDCLDLIVRQLFNPLPMCLDGGDAITGAISNGGVTYTNLAVNSGTATYQCDDGFSILDDNSRECQGNGSWSGTLPTCQKDGMRLTYGILVVLYTCIHVHFQRGNYPPPPPPPPPTKLSTFYFYPL